jgi:hypothetical protein
MKDNAPMVEMHTPFPLANWQFCARSQAICLFLKGVTIYLIMKNFDILPMPKGRGFLLLIQRQHLPFQVAHP